LTENIPFGSHFIERRLNQNGSVAAFLLFCFFIERRWMAAAGVK
jgi:hypothetical protein